MSNIKKFGVFLTEKNISAKINIPEDVREIANAYHKAGKDLFVVGGAVRDYLQDKVPHDFDLVTNALPKESEEILKDFRVSDEQGKNFAVIRVYTETEPLGHEIASYRKDIAHGRDTKGDDEKVEIGNHITMEDDAQRRDLTINALYYDIVNNEIIDLVGGVSDIKNKIIKSVGDASERFKEDRLRILRAIRFTARVNGDLELNTGIAIKKDNRLTGISTKEDVSRERIHEEWFKITEHAENSNNPNKVMQDYIELLIEFDMLKEMFGDFDFNTNINITTLEKSIIMSDLFSNVELTAKLKNKLVEKYKFDSKVMKKMDFLEKLKKISIDNIYELTLSREKFHITSDFILDATDHFGLDKTLIDCFIDFSNNGIITDGNDLKEQGFKGKAIADEKKRLELERFTNLYVDDGKLMKTSHFS